MKNRTFRSLLAGGLVAFALTGFSSGASAQSRCIVTYRSAGFSQVVEAYVSDAVDERPQFPGGETAMRRFINRERRYPRAEYEAGIEGRVLCSFIVNADGTIGNIDIVRGGTPDMNSEAVRIISNMPRWIPGSVDGCNVPVYYLLPIPFRL